MIKSLENKIEIDLNKVQEKCTTRTLTKEEIIERIKEAEKITKKLKNCGLEFKYTFQNGEKHGGYAYIGTSFYAYFNKNGECNKVDIKREKHGWDIDALEFKKTDGDLTVLEKKLLRESYNATTSNRIVVYNK